MICPVCSEVLLDGMRYCSHCGIRVLPTTSASVSLNETPLTSSPVSGPVSSKPTDDPGTTFQSFLEYRKAKALEAREYDRPTPQGKRSKAQLEKPVQVCTYISNMHHAYAFVEARGCSVYIIRKYCKVACTGRSSTAYIIVHGRA